MKEMGAEDRSQVQMLIFVPPPRTVGLRSWSRSKGEASDETKWGAWALIPIPLLSLDASRSEGERTDPTEAEAHPGGKNWKWEERNRKQHPWRRSV